ncbi:putative molybdopterin synthase sulfur carrier [Chloropicon primus]|uniref:Putative molybdopterin synthase sulfur carrier n=1 Tax=Chloropicon primus TaxID=1764295 RepID=A0A5B8MEE8_9CHLO|nr:putative molybdopterin synthase sulfur carrier [Chloropicon primus]UPQ98020.1 putative molybdopterin synthase sulfur carrier [Chloropicon primus]|eukprot:QDZ18813.1 putative molybdopterin synthase sulfur carrier [Chloropicon primus]
MVEEVEVKVVYFASAREAVGSEGEAVRLEAEGHGEDGEPYVTTDVLVKVLLERHPKLRAIFNTIVLAVNMDYADKGQSVRLKGRDEVALIPPIGGG